MMSTPIHTEPQKQGQQEQQEQQEQLDGQRYQIQQQQHHQQRQYSLSSSITSNGNVPFNKYKYRQYTQQQQQQHNICMLQGHMMSNLEIIISTCRRLLYDSTSNTGSTTSINTSTRTRTRTRTEQRKQMNKINHVFTITIPRSVPVSVSIITVILIVSLLYLLLTLTLTQLQKSVSSLLLCSIFLPTPLPISIPISIPTLLLSAPFTVSAFLPTQQTVQVHSTIQPFPLIRSSSQPSVFVQLQLQVQVQVPNNRFNNHRHYYLPKQTQQRRLGLHLHMSWGLARTKTASQRQRYRQLIPVTVPAPAHSIFNHCLMSKIHPPCQSCLQSTETDESFDITITTPTPTQQNHLQKPSLTQISSSNNLVSTAINSSQPVLDLSSSSLQLSLPTSSSSSPFDGLSKFHLSILSRSYDRQLFVTGRYPLYVSVARTNPTRKWLNLSRKLRGDGTQTAETELLVNGTTPDRSLASIERFQWLHNDDDNDNTTDCYTSYNNNNNIEQCLVHNQYSMVSMELLAEIHIERPGYLHVLSKTGPGSSTNQLYPNRHIGGTNTLQNFGGSTNNSNNNNNKNNNNKYLQQYNILTKLQQSSTATNIATTTTTTTTSTNSNDRLDSTSDRLWVTGFSLAGRKGLLSSVDVDTSQLTSINQRSASILLWPNEVQTVPQKLVHYQCQLPTTTATTTTSSSSSQIVADDNTQQKQQQNLLINKDNEHNYHHHHHSEDDTKIDTSAQNYHNDETSTNQDALLVSDGFLVPTKDRGGLYIVKNPGHPTNEDTIRLTNDKERWFYHRAVWIDLTNDGRRSLLTARCKVSTVLNSRPKRHKQQQQQQQDDGGGRNDNVMMITSGIRKYGQLIWLECPKPHSFHPDTGVPLEQDGSVFDPFAKHHLPWQTHILTTGPDVMFAIADLDTTDDTIEVISSQFFNNKVVLHSIKKGIRPSVQFSRDIDDTCGPAFGCILANLDVVDDDDDDDYNKDDASRRNIVIDSGSTVKTLVTNDVFSHLLVTSHECSYKTETNSNNNADIRDDPVDVDSALADGGSLFAYRIPTGHRDAWKVDKWIRSTVASGFTVSGQLSNMINPGAPGFVYTFHSQRSSTVNSIDRTHRQRQRPLIAVAGDCAESAYIFRPATDEEINDNDTNGSNGSYNTDSCTSIIDRSTQYKLMVEIDCGATVGSIGIGYGDCFNTGTSTGSNLDMNMIRNGVNNNDTFDSVDDSNKSIQYAKLYVPCYEKDMVLVFGLGNGDDS